MKRDEVVEQIRKHILPKMRDVIESVASECTDENRRGWVRAECRWLALRAGYEAFMRTDEGREIGQILGIDAHTPFTRGYTKPEPPYLAFHKAHTDDPGNGQWYAGELALQVAMMVAGQRPDWPDAPKTRDGHWRDDWLTEWAKEVARQADEWDKSLPEKYRQIGEVNEAASKLAKLTKDYWD